MPIQNVLARSLAAAACAALLTAAPAAGQLANASATTLGVAGNATAVARGLAAISVNPAGLGMPGSGSAFALAPVQVRSSLGPVTLGDLSDFAGKVVPTATKTEWLDRVTADGGESGTAAFEGSAFALAIGRVGVQVSTLGMASADLSPGAVEGYLYGNGGRTGSPATLTLTDSGVDGFVVSTVGASIGLPIASPTGDMAFGATVKYSLGHAVVVGRERASAFTAEPLRLSAAFPVISIDTTGVPIDVGSGWGLDIGFQMKRGNLALGGAVLNVVSTFEWDVDQLVFWQATANADDTAISSEFEKQPIGAAPSALVNVLGDLKFDPVFSAGLGYDATPDLTISADLRNRFGDGMQLAPKLHFGAGAEYRGLRVLHLRGGGAFITDGLELAGGASLVLGPVNISGGAGVRYQEESEGWLAQLTLSFGGR